MSEYLPKQMSEEETKKMCSEIIENLKISSLKEMGKVMGELKKNNSNIKKIEVYRKEVNKEFLYKNDNNIVAIALENTNTKIYKDIFKLDLNDYCSIADFIIKNNFEINND